MEWPGAGPRGVIAIDGFGPVANRGPNASGQTVFIWQTLRLSYELIHLSIWALPSIRRREWLLPAGASLALIDWTREQRRRARRSSGSLSVWLVRSV